MQIREACDYDFEKIWIFFKDIIKKNDTYAYNQNLTKDEAIKLWMYSPIKTYVIEDNDMILGSYYIKQNQEGNGNHVCNCGYMVSAKARGKGLASKMCKHSQKEAIRLGFKAMQYNFVVSTNVIAVKLWEKLGFEIVGKIPKGFNHPKDGFVDSFIMYKWLE